MQRKRLEDMNLLDDFLFNAVMTFPGIGERFCSRFSPGIMKLEKQVI